MTPNRFEQHVRGGPAGGRSAFHQRDRQIDADAVTGEREALVRGGNRRPVGEVAWGKPRTIVAPQHFFADDFRAAEVSG